MYNFKDLGWKQNPVICLKIVVQTDMILEYSIASILATLKDLSNDS